MKQHIYFLTMLTFATNSYGMEKATEKALTKETKRSRRRSMSPMSYSPSFTRSFTSKKKSHSSTELSQSITETEEEHAKKIFPIDEKNINSIDLNGDTILMWAARHNQQTTVQKLMEYESLRINYKHQKSGNTALHLCAQKTNTPMIITDTIMMFITNAKTDTSILNNESKLAHSLIPTNSVENRELRAILFARIMLDLTVEKIAKKIQENFFNIWIPLPEGQKEQKEQKEKIEKIILPAVLLVKEWLINDQNSQQEDRELPDHAKLPSYATDEFIKNMFISRLTAIK